MGTSSPGEHEGGFTLLELLISLGIMAIALVSVFSLLARNLENQSESRFLTVGHCLLQDRLARIQAREILSPGRFSGSLDGEAAGATFVEEIEKPPEPDGLWRVKVTISFQENRPARELWAEILLYRPVP